MASRQISPRRKYLNYLANHIEFNAAIHLLGGVSLGILIASPLTFPHPVRWALFFLALSLLGHIYAYSQKK